MKSFCLAICISISTSSSILGGYSNQIFKCYKRLYPGYSEENVKNILEQDCQLEEAKAGTSSGPPSVSTVVSVVPPNLSFYPNYQGIYNVHAAKGLENPEIRRSLLTCYLHFVYKARELAHLNLQKLNEDQSEWNGLLNGGYDDFTKIIGFHLFNALNRVGQSYQKEIRNQVRVLVRNLLICLKEQRVPDEYLFDKMPLRNELQKYYEEKFTGLEAEQRINAFMIDCPPTPYSKSRTRRFSTETSAGTSSTSHSGPARVAVSEVAYPVPISTNPSANYPRNPSTSTTGGYQQYGVGNPGGYQPRRYHPYNSGTSSGVQQGVTRVSTLDELFSSNNGGGLITFPSTQSGRPSAPSYSSAGPREDPNSGFIIFK